MEKVPLLPMTTLICIKNQFQYWILIIPPPLLPDSGPVPLTLTPTYIDPDYGRDPSWDTLIYNQDLLQFQHVLDFIELYNKSAHENPPITEQENEGTHRKVVHERWHHPSSVPKLFGDRELLY